MQNLARVTCFDSVGVTPPWHCLLTCVLTKDVLSSQSEFTAKLNESHCNTLTSHTLQLPTNASLVICSYNFRELEAQCAASTVRQSPYQTTYMRIKLIILNETCCGKITCPVRGRFGSRFTWVCLHVENWKTSAKTDEREDFPFHTA